MIRIIFITLIFTTLLSCQSQDKKTTGSKEYVAIYKSDTAFLSITMDKNRFYGTLKIFNRGVSPDSGSIEGDIKGNNLVGTYYYTPHRSREPKRKAFALLKNQDTFVEGTGLQQIYMGIPYYEPSSLSFDNPKFIYKEKK